MARQIVYDIELGGSVRRFNLGMNCWETFCEKMNVGPTEIISAFTGPTSFRAMRTLAFSAIAADDYLKGAPTSITEREVAGWLNDDAGKIGEIFGIAMMALAPEGEPADGKPVKVGSGVKKKRSHSRK